MLEAIVQRITLIAGMLSYVGLSLGVLRACRTLNFTVRSRGASPQRRSITERCDDPNAMTTYRREAPTRSFPHTNR